ncbi:MAG: hypothetical protein K2J76_03060, partial [Oscillospiraceae bacterium]|nr:hypothetical protein [Oscillospiraceae bacterium]
MRTIRKIIKFNDDEWQAVCKRAEFLNLRTGTYIRRIAVREVLKVLDMKKINRVLVSFHRIGNLLEQILRVAKKEQLPYTSEIQKFINVY